MATCTQFGSYEEYRAESPWSIEDPEDLEEASTAELDRYVRRTSQFDGWVAMGTGQPAGRFEPGY